MQINAINTVKNNYFSFSTNNIQAKSPLKQTFDTISFSARKTNLEKLEEAKEFAANKQSEVFDYVSEAYLEILPRVKEDEEIFTNVYADMKTEKKRPYMLVDGDKNIFVLSEKNKDNIETLSVYGPYAQSKPLHEQLKIKCFFENGDLTKYSILDSKYNEMSVNFNDNHIIVGTNEQEGENMLSTDKVFVFRDGKIHKINLGYTHFADGSINSTHSYIFRDNQLTQYGFMEYLDKDNNYFPMTSEVYNFVDNKLFAYFKNLTQLDENTFSWSKKYTYNENGDGKITGSEIFRPREKE